MKFSTLDWIAFILVIIGGLNWGLQALGWNLVDNIFGMDTMITKVIYIVVALATIYHFFTVKKLMKPASMM